MDLFDTAPCLTRDIIDDFRNQFNDLSTAYHIEKRYLNQHRDKKFLFTDELFLGVKDWPCSFIENGSYYLDIAVSIFNPFGLCVSPVLVYKMFTLFTKITYWSMRVVSVFTPLLKCLMP